MPEGENRRRFFSRRRKPPVANLEDTGLSCQLEHSWRKANFVDTSLKLPQVTTLSRKLFDYRGNCEDYAVDYSTGGYFYEATASSSSSSYERDNTKTTTTSSRNFCDYGTTSDEMDAGPFDDPIFSDFGGRTSATGVHSIQVMLGLHGAHHTGELMPPGGHLQKLDSSNSPPPSHHQTSHHHLQQQQQQQQKELKELELAGMYAPMSQNQDVTTSSSTGPPTTTSAPLQQSLQLGNTLKRKSDDPMTSGKIVEPHS